MSISAGPSWCPSWRPWWRATARRRSWWRGTRPCGRGPGPRGGWRWRGTRSWPGDQPERGMRSRDPAPASHWPGWCWPRSSTSWPRCPAPTPGTTAACRRAASRTGPRVATTRCYCEGDLLPAQQLHHRRGTASGTRPPGCTLLFCSCTQPGPGSSSPTGGGGCRQPRCLQAFTRGFI